MRKNIRYKITQAGFLFVITVTCIFNYAKSEDWLLQDTTRQMWEIDIDKKLKRDMERNPIFENLANSDEKFNYFYECKESIEKVLKYSVTKDSSIELVGINKDADLRNALRNRNKGLIRDKYHQIEKDGEPLLIWTNLAFIKNKWEINKGEYKIKAIDRVEMLNLGTEIEDDKWISVFHMKIQDTKGWIRSEFAAVLKTRDFTYVLFATKQR